ncbi:MAG: protein-glutamate O-methyltransferase CheR [Pseudomonadota bacterium]
MNDESPPHPDRRLHSRVTEAMTEADMIRVAQRIRTTAGIVLDAQKRQMVVARLGRRLRTLGMTRFRDYLDYLDHAGDPAEAQHFVNTLTTNLTFFFREPHHFEHFDREVLAPPGKVPPPALRLWSAGCSSGEEPYSLGLTVLQRLGHVPADTRILATDIDTDMLQIARAGSYRIDQCERIPARLRTRHLTRSENGAAVQMPAALGRAISFAQLNLLDRWPISVKFHAIFCRNTLIYFDHDTKAALVDRFAAALHPGGYLYLGHSESLLNPHPLLESCGSTIYRRRTE